MTSHGDSSHEGLEACHCTLCDAISCSDAVDNSLTSRHRVPRAARPWPPPPPPSYGRRPFDQVLSSRASSPRAIVSCQAAGSVFYDVVRPLNTEPSPSLYSEINDSTRSGCSTASTAAIVQPYCYLDDNVDTPDRAVQSDVHANARTSSVSLPRASMATSTRPRYDIQTLDSHNRTRLKLNKTRDVVQALAGTNSTCSKFMSRSCPNIRLMSCMAGGQPRRAAVMSTFGKSRPAVQHGFISEDCCNVQLGFENSVYLGAGREVDLFSGEDATLPVSETASGRELQGDRTRLTSHQSHQPSYGTLPDTRPCSSRARAFLATDRSGKPDSIRPNSAVCKPIIASRHHKVP